VVILSGLEDINSIETRAIRNIIYYQLKDLIDRKSLFIDFSRFKINFKIFFLALNQLAPVLILMTPIKLAQTLW